MTKKRLLITSLCCALPIVVIIVALGQVVYENRRASLGSNALTPRTQEFLAQQQALADSPWKNTQTSAAPATTQTTSFGNTECLTFSLNAATRDQKIEQTDTGCVLRLTTLQPLGHLVITLTRHRATPLSEESGVRLRETHPERFVKIPSAAPSNFTSLAQYTSADGMVTFLRREDTTLVVAFGEYATMSAQLHTWHDEILTTLEISPAL